MRPIICDFVTLGESAAFGKLKQFARSGTGEAAILIDRFSGYDHPVDAAGQDIGCGIGGIVLKVFIVEDHQIGIEALLQKALVLQAKPGGSHAGVPVDQGFQGKNGVVLGEGAEGPDHGAPASGMAFFLPAAHQTVAAYHHIGQADDIKDIGIADGVIHRGAHAPVGDHQVEIGIKGVFAKLCGIGGHSLALCLRGVGASKG